MRLQVDAYSFGNIVLRRPIFLVKKRQIELVQRCARDEKTGRVNVIAMMANPGDSDVLVELHDQQRGKLDDGRNDKRVLGFIV